MLRAPRHEDVKAIAVLANDRRIAENTARIPHPYRRRGRRAVRRRRQPARRRSLHSSSMLDGTLIGACGIDPRDDGAEIGYWLGAGLLGPRLHDRSGARA